MRIKNTILTLAELNRANVELIRQCIIAESLGDFDQALWDERSKTTRAFFKHLQSDYCQRELVKWKGKEKELEAELRLLGFDNMICDFIE